MGLVLTSATQSNKSLGVQQKKHFHNVYSAVNAVCDQTMKGLRDMGIVSPIEEERLKRSIKKF
jgi:hypothetical protein